MNYAELASDLVKKCLKSGADAAEVYIESGRDMNVRVRDGETETIQESAASGVGIRVFVKNRLGFAHCNNFSPAALAQTVEQAVEFARIVTPDKNNLLPDDRSISRVDRLYDPDIAAIPVDRKIKLIRELEQLAVKDKRITKSAGASFADGEVHVYLANSSGLHKDYPATYCSMGVSVVAEKGEQKSSGGEACTRRFFSLLKQAEAIASKAARDAYEMLDPRIIKTQKAAVIFDPDVAYAVLGGILRAVHGERVLQGASFLARSLNKQVASTHMTLIDDGILPGGLNSAPFDGEGVPTQRRVIIDRGFLKDFMHNTITARRGGVKSTGNASRGGFSSLPGIGPHNFYMEGGSHEPSEIIRNTATGLLLKGVTGYGINPVNGYFSGGASGFWIENGTVRFPVKGITIAGNAEEMLKNIDMVANDLDLNRGLSAPTFRIREMQIGGE